MSMSGSGRHARSASKRRIAEAQAEREQVTAERTRLEARVTELEAALRALVYAGRCDCCVEDLCDEPQCNCECHAIERDARAGAQRALAEAKGTRDAH